MLNHLKCEYMFVLERKQELLEKCWMSSVSEQDPFLRKEYLNFLKVCQASNACAHEVSAQNDGNLPAQRGRFTVCLIE